MSSCCSKSSPACDTVSVLDFGHCNRNVVRSHFCSNLQFSNDMRCWTSCYVLTWYLYIFVGEMSVRDFAHFKKLGCSFSLHFEWQSFLQYVFYWYFPQACGWSSYPSDLSFAEQTFLIVVKSSLWTFSFMDHVFGFVSKKSLSCRSFITLCFTFSSRICFELTFVKGGRVLSKFMRMCSWSSSVCWKDYLCSMALPLLLCQWSVDCIMWVCFWVLGSVPLM